MEKAISDALSAMTKDELFSFLPTLLGVVWAA